MLLDIGLKEALARLKNPKLILNETIIPANSPQVPNSRYRTGYDWLFKYERELIDFLAPWLSAHREELIGEKGLLSESLSNAFCHGNGRDPRQPIRVRIFCGESGLLIQISDNGSGFDVAGITDRFYRKKPYYHLAGNGLQLLIDSKTFGAFFNAKGNKVHFIYATAGDLSSWNRPGDKTETAPDGSGSIRTVDGAGKQLTKDQAGFPFSDSPPESIVTEGTIMVDPEGHCIGEKCRKESRRNRIAGSCRSLYDSALALTHCLGLGTPNCVYVQTPKDAIVMIQALENQCLAAIFQMAATNPVLARKTLLDQIEKHRISQTATTSS